MLSGVLIGCSYIPFSPWLLPVAVVPLAWQLVYRSKTWKESFWQGWWTQFVLSLIGFHWIAYVSREFGFFPWPVAISALLVFAALMHLYWALATALAFGLRHSLGLGPALHLLILSVLVVLGEAWWPSLFRWSLGYGVTAAGLPWAQFAEWIGVLGLSFFVLLLNSSLVLSLSPGVQQTWRRFVAPGLWLVALLLLVPKAESLKSRAQATDRSFRVLMVQANIGNVLKFYAEKGNAYQSYILDRNIELTRRGLEEHRAQVASASQGSQKDIDLVVWPETAFTDYLNPWWHGASDQIRLLEFIRMSGVDFYMGAYSQDPPGTPGQDAYNATYVVNSKGGIEAGPYHKTHLLIFGEYAPFRKTLPWLAQFNPGGEGFGTGSGPTVFSWRDLKIGNQICYESLFPDFSRHLALLGAHVIFNVTNDSWFNPVGGPHFEAHQHMQMTMARTLETRLPMVRSTNTGITTVGLADGSIVPWGPMFAEWTGVFDVPYASQPRITVYTRYGGWLPWLLICGLTFCLIVASLGNSKLSQNKAAAKTTEGVS